MAQLLCHNTKASFEAQSYGQHSGFLDEDGEPVQGAQVTALRSTFGNGQRELAHAGEARTNDLGEYRIYGLAPGQYIVEALKQPRLFAVLKPEQGYVPIYYPWVSDAARAAPIAVPAGDELSFADITLQTTQTSPCADTSSAA
jgi:hypothetical protein